MVMAWPHLMDAPYLLVDTIFQSIKRSMGPTLDLMNGNIYETQNTPKTYFLNFCLGGSRNSANLGGPGRGGRFSARQAKILPICGTFLPKM